MCEARIEARPRSCQSNPMRRSLQSGLAIVSFVALVFAGVACQSDPESDPDEGDGSLCPSCRPNAGGETSDFGSGGGPDCAERAAELTPEVERAFRLEALRAQLAAPIALAARWIADQDANPFTPSEDADPFGDELGVELEVELGEIAYLESDVCGNRIEAPFTVKLRADDGSLASAAQGVLRHGAGAPAAQLRAHGDLRDAMGSLELDVDERRLHLGLVDVVLAVTTSEISGQVVPVVYYFANEPLLEAHGSFSDGATWEDVYAPYQLRFPL
jgi:hypothetical protein